MVSNVKRSLFVNSFQYPNNKGINERQNIRKCWNRAAYALTGETGMQNPMEVIDFIHEIEQQQQQQ